MSISIFGLLAAVLGFAGQLLGIRFLIFCFVISALFISTSAISLGGKPVLVTFVFLGFIILYLLRVKNFGQHLLQMLQNNSAVKWFAIFVLYSILVSFITPAIFGGEVRVVSLFMGKIEAGFLTFGGGHIAQIIYAVMALVIVLAVSSMVSLDRRILEYFALAILWMGALNIVFAVADLLNFYIGFPDIINVFRNTEYAMLDQSFGAVRRVAGIFPETSAFSGFTAALACFAYFLYRSRVYPQLSFWVTVLSTVFVLIATSTSGYVGLAMFGLLIALSELPNIKVGTMSKVVFFSALLSVAVALVLSTVFYKEAYMIFEHAVLNKLDSDSGVERMQWNEYAWGDFLETYGLGVGLGGNRASSYLLVLLSNVGLVGTLLYVAAFVSVLKGSVETNTPTQSVIGAAAKRSLCVAIFPAMASATAPWQGAIFYTFLALANTKDKQGQ